MFSVCVSENDSGDKQGAGERETGPDQSSLTVLINMHTERDRERGWRDIVKYCVSVRVCVVVLREVLCVSVKCV